ncbi:PP2C family protein-serine/threonine phosphatase, partial [Candidatus Riflebacteria bacterium]
VKIVTEIPEKKETLAPLTVGGRPVCPRPECNGIALLKNGICPNCWWGKEKIEEVMEEYSPLSVEKQFELSLTLHSAQHQTVNVLNLEFEGMPIAQTSDLVPSELQEADYLVFMANAKKRGLRWVSTFIIERNTQLRPFHYHLKQLKSKNALVKYIGNLLEFFTLLESKHFPGVQILPDSIWVHPNSSEHLLFVGPKVSRTWGSIAAHFISETIMFCVGLNIGDGKSEVLVECLNALLATDPPMPPKAIAILGTFICEGGRVGDFLKKWRNMERKVLLEEKEGRLYTPFRLGFAQIVGRRNLSDLKLIQEQQEDRICSRRVRIKNQNCLLLAIADGVTDCDFGSGAALAQKAIDAIMEQPMVWKKSGTAFLRNIFQAVSEAVAEYISKTRNEDAHDDCPPSCTLTTVLVYPNSYAEIAWVGDSPALLWEGESRTFIPLTHPHTHGFDGLFQGHDCNTIRKWDYAANLSRYIGSVPSEPDINGIRLEPDDGILIVSGGLLNGFISDTLPGKWFRAIRNLGRFFSWSQPQTENLSTLCEKVCFEADRLRGKDNVSAIFMASGREEKVDLINRLKKKRKK